MPQTYAYGKTPSGFKPMKIKVTVFGIFLAGALLSLSGCAPLHSQGYTPVSLSHRDYDVVLEAIAIQVKPLMANSTVDAIDLSLKESGDMNAIVIFKIQEVLEGEFTKEKAGGPSKLAQLGEAASEKQILKLLTLDFKDPNSLVAKDWISVAVPEPEKTFSLNSWKDPSGKIYRLYLKRDKEQKNSYVLTGVSWKADPGSSSAAA